MNRRICIALSLSIILSGCVTQGSSDRGDNRDFDAFVGSETERIGGRYDPVRTKALYDVIGYEPVTRKSR